MTDKSIGVSTNVIITSSERVKISGHYVYDGHVGESCNSYIPDKARSGLYLAEGSIAPQLTCLHWIRWKLIQ